MIVRKTFSSIKEMNLFITYNGITKTNIISITSFYDRGNTNWGILVTEIFYFDEFSLGEDNE